MDEAIPRKPSLDENFLSKHNITLYEDGDEYRAKIPLHVKLVKEELLNFRLLPRSFKAVFRENLDQFLSDPKQNWLKPEKVGNGAKIPPMSLQPQAHRYCKRAEELGLFANVREIFRERLNESISVAEQALLKARTNEASWQRMYGSKLFKAFECALDGLSCTCGKFQEKWSLQEDTKWCESLSVDNESSGCPKPDFTYAFPVSERNDPDFPALNTDYAENFSLKFLKKAMKVEELKCFASGKSQTGDQRWRQHHRMCYPWAIMEAKHDMSTAWEIEKCKRQAANGAAVALDMRANLYAKAGGDESRALSAMPPMIAFTCIGPLVWVWLAWQVSESKPATKMICIWATDIRLTWGAYSTQLIVANMHDWVSRSLKPQLSEQLGKVRSSLGSAPRSPDRFYTDPSGVKVRSDQARSPDRIEEVGRPKSKPGRSHSLGKLNPSPKSPSAIAPEASVSPRVTNRRSRKSAPPMYLRRSPRFEVANRSGPGERIRDSRSPSPLSLRRTPCLNVPDPFDFSERGCDSRSHSRRNSSASLGCGSVSDNRSEDQSDSEEDSEPQEDDTDGSDAGHDSDNSSQSDGDEEEASNTSRSDDGSRS